VTAAKHRITSAFAGRLLSSVPSDKAFAFYSGMDMPTGKYASSLQDLCQCFLEVAPQSVAFHLEREDFQNWLRHVIGDKELASKLSGLRGTGLSPEELRSKVYDMVKLRYDELSAALART
jgi:hypothetical protein